MVWNREIETICKIAVSYPLTIGTEVGDRALDLDDHEVTCLAEAEEICAASADERKLDEDSVAELAEGAANTPRE